MNYPLKDLLQIRRLRETAAIKKMMSAKARLEAAQQAEMESRKEFTSYHEWRLEEEKRIFQRIFHRYIRISDLESVKNTVGSLREMEIDLSRKHQEFISCRIEAEKNFKAAREQYFTSHREKQKIELHREDFLMSFLKEMERLEDLEMEEFHKFHQEWSAEAVYDSP